MDSLPPELFLYFFSLLPLTSLIAVRGVSTKWRSLALTASIHPTREVLLNLYLTSIVHPRFPIITETLRPYVHRFDREQYIAKLTSQGCVLPDIFEIWILEWPSKAVHFWSWPGLEREPWERSYHYELFNALSVDADPSETHCYGTGNPASGKPPIIDTIPVPKKEVGTVGSKTCRALSVFEVYFHTISEHCRLWMVVDENEEINDRRAGRLIWTYEEYDDDWTPLPRKICYDSLLGPPTNKLVDFLDMLDVSHEMEAIADGNFWNSIGE